MADLPDPESSAFRAIALSGRIPLLADAAARLADAMSAGEGLEGDALALALLQAMKGVQDWLETEGAAAAAELDSLRKAVGIPSEFH